MITGIILALLCMDILDHLLQGGNIEIDLILHPHIQEEVGMKDMLPVLVLVHVPLGIEEIDLLQVRHPIEKVGTMREVDLLPILL